MRKFDRGMSCLLLVGFTLGASLSLVAQADNGLIVITRDVQVRNATRPR